MDFKCSVCGLDGFQDGQEMLIDRAGVVFCLKCWPRNAQTRRDGRCLRSDGSERPGSGRQPMRWRLRMILRIPFTRETWLFDARKRDAAAGICRNHPGLTP